MPSSPLARAKEDAATDSVTLALLPVAVAARVKGIPQLQRPAHRSWRRPAWLHWPRRGSRLAGDLEFGALGSAATKSSTASQGRVEFLRRPELKWWRIPASRPGPRQGRSTAMREPPRSGLGARWRRHCRERGSSGWTGLCGIASHLVAGRHRTAVETRKRRRLRMTARDRASTNTQREAG